MTQFQTQYGPWAIVTGASSGIGQELAKGLAARGLNVVLNARSAAALDVIAKEIETEHQVETRVVAQDLSTMEGLTALFDATENLEVGLIAPSAGLMELGAIEKTDRERALRILDLNVRAPLALVHHFAPAMIARGKGGILLVSSLSGINPNPYLANYAGSKAYVTNFGHSLYGELRPKGVDVTVLTPGLTATPMTDVEAIDWDKMPMKAMQASDVARVALDALGRKPSVIPGGRNAMMGFMAKIAPAKMSARMNEKMMRKAVSPDVL